MTEEAVALDVTIDRGKQTVGIVWSDESRSEFTFAFLRSICPCAHCDATKHGGEADPGRPTENDFAGITMRSVEEVGRYALRFTWSDGHDAGIYSYAFLRSIGPN